MSVDTNGVELCFYRDRSGPTFKICKPGAKYTGINERLCARDKNQNLTTNSNAVTLHYTRGFGFCDMKYVTIDGDLGRGFVHQPWAKGILPIMHVARILDYNKYKSLKVFKFDTEEASKNEALYRAAGYLVIHAMQYGFVAPPNLNEVVEILYNMGLTAPADPRKIFSKWDNAGMFGGKKIELDHKLYYSGILPQEYPGVSPIKSSIPSKDFFSKRDFQATINFLVKLEKIFEPYTLVPKIDLHVNSSDYNLLKFQ